MITILDASTLLNLANGGVLSEVLAIEGRTYQVSGVVREESRTIAEAIDAAVEGGRIDLVDDTLISATEYADAKEAWQLGGGETECILAARALDCAVASDDGAARAVVTKMFGNARLTGSIGLLRDAVTAGKLTRDEAFRAYQSMRVRGGYLPDIAQEDF